MNFGIQERSVRFRSGNQKRFLWRSSVTGNLTGDWSLVSNKKVSTSMRKATRISLALGTSAALLSLCAVPASAVDGDGTVPPVVLDSEEATATIVVHGGPISISVARNVAADKEFVPGTQAQMDIPEFTVTDERAGIEGWTVRVALTDFTSANAADSDAVIPSSGATYTTAVVGTPLGTATVASLGGSFVADEKAATVTALTATSVRGNNTAAWTSSLEVPVPPDALAGTYTATLTHSIL